ncbi:MAG TPA: hypothetical protein PLA03_11085 [Acidobacteriota bacterium]|nr:hypothetical protein [Acidobacteriota bacterium]
MKMLFIVTDSEYEPHCLKMMREKGISGYTMIHDVSGVGKGGAKMGDRLHPGASVLIMSAIEDSTVEGIMGCISQCVRSSKLCESTHAWVVPIEASLTI